MGEHAITQDQAAGFVEKLNGFIATLDEQEQGWLVALLTRPSPEEDVQGYMVLPPFSLIDLPQAPEAAGAGKVAFHDLHFVKYVDKASPKLF
jgi:hypothetical protein